MFVDWCEVAEDEVQTSRYHSMKYKVTRWAAADTLDTHQKQNFDHNSRIAAIS